jgi:hypothetical protein
MANPERSRKSLQIIYCFSKQRVHRRGTSVHEPALPSVVYVLDAHCVYTGRVINSTMRGAACNRKLQRWNDSDYIRAI